MKTVAEQHASWCVHYQRDPSKMFGKGEERCKAGVSYDELAKVADLGRTGCALRLPCIKRHHDPAARRGQPLMECEALQWPTAEECAEEEEQAEQAIARLMTAAPVIAEVKQLHKGENWQGTRDCPVCGGALTLRHSAYNGHVHGQCSTAGCLSWME